MKTVKFEIRFATPAFLGNAEQDGQWRTPPIKAQLRQWWRVAFAASHQFRIREQEMRRLEGRLFGHAWLDDDRNERGDKVAARRSEIRIRLDNWRMGTMDKRKWRPLAAVSHPEVKFPVDSGLYMGYGPVVLPRGERQSTLKSNAAIQADEHAALALAYPDDAAALIEHALWLMDRYGTVGGRSRNGWGAYCLDAEEGAALLTGMVPLRPWREGLSTDWPHAIGADERGALIWQTAPHKAWESLMREMAVMKIGLRTQLVFNTGKNALSPEGRHWLSYPVTNHSVKDWGGNARLPNSLRFKVRPTPDGQLVGVIFHVPCLPPAGFHPDLRTIESVWSRVHAFLDSQAPNLSRIPE